MPRISMMPTFFRELLGKKEIHREPEPDLIMDDEEQVKAYAEAGRIDGVMSASYLFHSARITSVISGKKNVIDLGCGPATQLGQVASLNPDIHFTGIDLSEQMLKDAREYVKTLGLKNVEFMQGNITELSQIKTQSVDAVMSTMALHHLPTEQDLKNCFLEINRILKPDGALYLTDFGRLKSLYSILFFAYLNKEHQPALFSLDYERSLRAAFSVSDFVSLTDEVFINRQIDVLHTFGIPILQIIKTPDYSLSDEKSLTFKIMRKALPAKYQRELDDIRLFFWLSGLRNDPF